jgi:putative hydrolase of the HAD superfamily
MLKAIIFDYGDTLVRSKKTYRKAAQQLALFFKKLGHRISADEVYEKMESYFEDVEEERKKNFIELTPEEYSENILKLLSINFDKRIVKEVVDILTETTYEDRLREDTISTLEKLKKKFKIGIISNTHFYGPLIRSKKFGISKYTDIIVLSCIFGKAKPASEIFVYVLSKLKAKPKEAIFVGNDPFYDIYGAKKVGMKTVWITDNQTDLPKEQKPDYTIKELRELFEVIKNG